MKVYVQSFMNIINKVIQMEENVKSEKKNLEEKFADFLKRWPRLHALYMKYEEILVYLVVGGMTTVVSWSAKFLFNAVFYHSTENPTALQNYVLSFVNWTAGVIFAYFTNRAYVFKSHGPMLKEAPKFVLTRVSTLILDAVVMQVLCNEKLGICMKLLPATIISAVLVIIFNYIFSKLFVFKRGTK